MSRGFFLFLFLFYNMYKYILIQCALGFFFTLPKLYRSSSTKETYELLLPSHMPIFADISPTQMCYFKIQALLQISLNMGRAQLPFMQI